MKNILEVKPKNQKSYNIYFQDSFKELGNYLIEAKLNGNKALIITDDNVQPLYLDLVKEELFKVYKTVFTFVFPHGEDSKTIDTANKIYDYLIQSKCDRKTTLFALGGGIVGDITGFCASTYMRGVPYIQIPTTLLAQVDSSVGGKTAVNFNNYKNIVGAFYQPKLVYMNINTLKTLPNVEFACGMAEVIKSAILGDRDFYNYIKENINNIKKMDVNTLTYLSKMSCEIKGKVVSMDPEEKGIRAILNLGHTIGHSLEKYYDNKILHGEGVSIGLVSALKIAQNRGYITNSDFLEVKNLLISLNLPVSSKGINKNKVLDNIALDKKVENGKLKFILPTEIGKAEIFTDLSKEEILKGIEEIC